MRVWKSKQMSKPWGPPSFLYWLLPISLHLTSLAVRIGINLDHRPSCSESIALFFFLSFCLLPRYYVQFQYLVNYSQHLFFSNKFASFIKSRFITTYGYFLKLVTSSLLQLWIFPLSLFHTSRSSCECVWLPAVLFPTEICSLSTSVSKIKVPKLYS